MPTYNTVVDSFFRHAGAVIYLIVCCLLVIYLVYCCVMDVIDWHRIKKGQKNAEIRERKHRNR